MEAKVTWHNNLSFTATGGSGFSVPLGTAVEYGGANDGLRPMEMILVGLGGCTAMDVMSILGKKRQKVTQFEVSIQADRASDHPRVFTNIRVDYVLAGINLDSEAVERAVELSKNKYCSVEAMLSPMVPIEHRITIIPAP